ncbi:MAG: DeoR family transcriptional regulator [Christensenellales bacterium]
MKIDRLVEIYKVSRRTIRYDSEYLSLTYLIVTVRGRGGCVKILDGLNLRPREITLDQIAFLISLLPRLEGKEKQNCWVLFICCRAIAKGGFQGGAP